MKKCIYCGAELPQEASWCPYCEKSQEEGRTVTFPVRHRRKLILALLGILILGAAVFAFSRYHRPGVYEGGAEVMYRLNGKECRVFLSFYNDSVAAGKSAEEMTDREPAENSSAVPSQLSIRSDDDPDIEAAFLEQMKSCVVTAQPENDAEKVEIYGPEPGENSGFLGALKADVVYSPATGTNTICWEIRMKNKDILRLYQHVTCELLETIEYHYETTPMNSLEEINALIEKTEAESPDAVLALYLPPVTYEGRLNLERRTVTLIGTEVDGKRTTFTDTLQINTRTPVITELYQLEFAGNGGTGIIAKEALYAQACSFTGWDTGVDVENGGWVSLHDTAFVDNRTGFRWNSQKSTFSNEIFENIVFTENEVGLDVISIPGKEMKLNFTDPVFDANETDYNDPTGRVEIN